LFFELSDGFSDNQQISDFLFKIHELLIVNKALNTSLKKKNIGFIRTL